MARDLALVVYGSFNGKGQRRLAKSLIAELTFIHHGLQVIEYLVDFIDFVQRIDVRGQFYGHN